MTKQEYVDVMLTASVCGNLPSGNYETGQCYYRHEEKGCLVGLSMEGNYLPKFESSTITALVKNFGNYVFNFVPEGISLENLVELQAYHDSRVINKQGWNHEEFVEFLESMDCFKDCDFGNRIDTDDSCDRVVECGDSLLLV